MKFTIPLGKHNLYRMMRNQWKVARKRPVLPTNAEKVLQDHNLELIDANEFVEPAKKTFDFSSIVGLAPLPVAKDENHPLYKEQTCYFYRDHSVLLEGLPQALALTNTVQLEADTLPPRIQKLVDQVQLPNQDELVQRCIKTTCLYDAEQKKLPVRKDPQRPAWNFPRDYGITELRKNRMLCSRLVHLCSLASPELNGKCHVLHDAPLRASLLWDSDPVMLEVRADICLVSDKPLNPLVEPVEAEGLQVPELTVSHPLISLEEENFYEFKDVFPLQPDSKYSQVQTIIVHHNHTEVKNIFDAPVQESQLLGRSLMKAYTMAVTQARYNYGPQVKELPQPLVVQCVQTDGQNFHFSVLQLHSTEVDCNRRNVYWSLPPLSLYDDCSYIQAVPFLLGYNPQVFKQLLAFYINN
uniref:Large ribosomal subunit protein mL37 n=1 Tax=Cuerna arida TaxID=1464854 RepID=A0A1B6G2X7_9HEMI